MKTYECLVLAGNITLSQKHSLRVKWYQAVRTADKV